MRNKFLLALLLSTAVALFACSSLPTSSSVSDFADQEEYIIDFSKKIEGYQLANGPLPKNLNADVFFALLQPFYKDTGIMEKVRKYPVAVFNEGESYVLILCDKDARFTVLKDLGATTDRIDFPYYREQKQVPCDIK